MFIIYDLIFLAIAIIYLPVYLFKRKFHRGFFARLGFLPEGLELERPVWVHAVSVGEAMAVKRLLQELRKAFPQKKLVISTVTSTGNKIARAIAGSRDLATYLPLDFSLLVKRVFDRVNPCVFIIAETEIWPNLISYLYKKKIPVIVVNGRISDASFGGYMLVRFLLKPIFRKVSLFCVQGERDRKRLLRLGVPEDKIEVTGNMKFDIPLAQDVKKDHADCRKKTGLGSSQKLFVAGSTHPGEEEIVLGAYKGVLNQFPELKLLIAPRHPQRSKDAARIVSRMGFRPVFISSETSECPTCIPRPVFILDTVGELISYYRIADMVFVGGSLIRKGGHNILEPAMSAKPVMFGPHMFNFRDIADLFLAGKAAVMVYNQEDLKENIASLLNNPAKMLELGNRGKQVILENQGASARNSEFIARFLQDGN